MIKKTLLVLALIPAFLFVGCSGGNHVSSQSDSPESNSTESSTSMNTETENNAQGRETANAASNSETEKKTLVVYFSCTGNTKAVAEKINTYLNGSIEQIKAQEPYTDADLDYNNDNSRANIEQNDADARPEIEGAISDIESYDVIYVGYPIWWGELPKIMCTFFDSYDFSGKTIVPFCTSGGSTISKSVKEIETLEPGAIVKEGKRFSSSVSQDDIDNWIKVIS